MLKSPLNQERYKILLMVYFLIYRKLLEFNTFVQSLFSQPVNYMKDLRDFGLDKLTKEAYIIFLLSTDCLVLYVTWRTFLFSDQFDLNFFMKTQQIPPYSVC